MGAPETLGRFVAFAKGNCVKTVVAIALFAQTQSRPSEIQQSPPATSPDFSFGRTLHPETECEGQLSFFAGNVHRKTIISGLSGHFWPNLKTKANSRRKRPISPAAAVFPDY